MCDVLAIASQVPMRNQSTNNKHKKQKQKREVKGGAKERNVRVRGGLSIQQSKYNPKVEETRKPVLKERLYELFVSVGGNQS